MELSEIRVSKEHLFDITKNREYNKTIIAHYERLRDEMDIDIDGTKISGSNLSNKIDNISNCNSYWLLDHYVNQGIKDFKKTNLCKDKFCNNCKKVKQASRLTKFMPVIDELNKESHLYHLVLTVPNCNGSNLNETIKTMFKSFYSLNRYLKLEKKIKGFDFEKYSYKGAVRSLEVTYNGDSYHPHLHCIIALDKPLDISGSIVNTYSHSRNNGFRTFSEFEILIQKIWYLLNNGERVNKKSIDNLDLGYSCTIDLINENSVFEVFKYMTKSTDEKSDIIAYENFKTLYFSLFKVRQIQGYGCFYNIKDDDSIIEEVDDLYDVIVNILRAKENPVEVSEAPQDLLLDNDNLIISRKSIFKYYRKL